MSDDTYEITAVEEVSCLPDGYDDLPTVRVCVRTRRVFVLTDVPSTHRAVLLHCDNCGPWVPHGFVSRRPMTVRTVNGEGQTSKATVLALWFECHGCGALTRFGAE